MSTLALALALQTNLLDNPGFERAPAAHEHVPGWELAVGAQGGGGRANSTVELGEDAHEGERCLRLSGDARTGTWQMVKQVLEARPGGTYSLRGVMSANELQREEGQYDNAWAAVFVRDASGRELARQLRVPHPAREGWQDFELELAAPAGARSVEVLLFLSKSGELAFDALSLEVEGGEPLPPWEALMNEEFDAGALDSWSTSEGARHRTSGSANTLELEAGSGPEGVPALALRGETGTASWSLLSRRVGIRPGDELRLSGWVRAEGLHRSEGQFGNFWAGLVLFGEQGQLGAPQLAHFANGTTEWEPFELRTLVPAGASEAELRLFSTQSGVARFASLALERRPTGTTPFADWRGHPGAHVELRYPPDHPLADEIAAYAARLDAAYERVRSALGVPGYDERITVWSYKDRAQGRALTGRELAFADGPGRAVHMHPANTDGHELVHVIARAVGPTQAEWLSEGIAVWLDGTAPRTHRQRAHELLRDGALPGLDALFTRFRSLEAGYPAAGALVGYLIEREGMATFLRLYTSDQPRAALESLYDAALEELESAWHARLREET